MRHSREETPVTRHAFVTAAAGFLGLSVFLLGACGRTPTGPAAAQQALQNPDAADVATLDADQPTGMARTAVAAETQATPDAADDLSRREAELAAREQELRAQQEQLRRERERLAAGSRERSSATTDQFLDADQATVPPPGSSTSSIQKVPSQPIVVPPGTPLEIELIGNVNTKIARVGDRVEGRLATDLVVDERRAAVAGATVTGSVTELVAGSDTVDGATMLGLTFDSLQAANGATVPITARYRQQSTGDTVAAPQMGGDMKLRAGTVIRAPTETSFSIY
jgi:hypothetical protein